MSIDEKYVVLDIETYTPTGTPDPTKDELRYVGFKSCSGNYRIYHADEINEIQKALDGFYYLVGHNISEYDLPILARYGCGFRGVVIDTYEITKRRAKKMLYLDFNKGDLSLAKLCEFFKLKNNKSSFDYGLLSKPVLDENEYKLLEEYLKQDLDCAEELFAHYYNIFIGLKDLVKDYDKTYMNWLLTNPGTIAYKVICNLAGIQEVYDNEVIRKDEPDYEGAFVSDPFIGYCSGNIYCRDFNSLYPHMYMGGNLYSPTEDDGWSGSGIYPSVYSNDIDGINGSYSPQQGKIERVIEYLYKERKKVPKDDPRNLAYKIVLNTCYGITGNPVFKSLYNKTTASDCTAMARRSIKHARTVLDKNGYTVLYTDTDSCYILDPYNDEKKLDDVCDMISEQQRESFNIKITSHTFAKECKIKRMYFFKDDSGNFIKKHYIYVTDADKIVTKGMQIVKGSASPLAKEIYEVTIKPMILNGDLIVMPFQTLVEHVYKLAKEKPELLVKRFRVKKPEEYKVTEGKDESTSIHYSIAKKYGIGEHWLVINKRLGPGKGNHYCKLEELKDKYEDRWLEQVRIGEYIKDLREFIEPEDRKLIGRDNQQQEEIVV